MISILKRILKSRIKINWKYALGEFFIVVFGILVAFQLERWKENKQETALIKNYLSDIEVGLRTDSVFYENAVNYFDEILTNIELTIDQLETNSLMLSPASQKSLRLLPDWYQTYISNSAFQDLNSSGRMNLIEQKNLRYNIISYYQYIDFVKSLDKQYTQNLHNMHENLFGVLDLYTDETISIKEEDKRLLLNYLNQKKSYINSYLGHRGSCQSINNDVRKLIFEGLGKG